MERGVQHVFMSESQLVRNAIRSAVLEAEWLDPKRFLDYGFELRAPFNQANAIGVPTLTFGGSPVNIIGF